MKKMKTEETEKIDNDKIDNVHTEAVIWRYSVKMVFFDILQNLQENICSGVSFLIKL